ncbi:unnamed protein product [Pedinophyceae sp. YPF-701]|nr:unnamed protein product [Pedinophyceae sp. YPF-701]
MASTPGGPTSPSVDRLNRVLVLVTEHEAHVREQDIRLADLSRQLQEVRGQLQRDVGEVRGALASGQGAGWGAREATETREELDAARKAVEQLHGQIVAMERDAEVMQERQDDLGGVVADQNLEIVALKERQASIDRELKAAASGDSGAKQAAVAERIQKDLKAALRRSQHRAEAESQKKIMHEVGQQLATALQSSQAAADARIAALSDDVKSVSATLAELDPWVRREVGDMVRRIAEHVRAMQEHQGSLADRVRESEARSEARIRELAEALGKAVAQGEVGAQRREPAPPQHDASARLAGSIDALTSRVMRLEQMLGGARAAPAAQRGCGCGDPRCRCGPSCQCVGKGGGCGCGCGAGEEGAKGVTDEVAELRAELKRARCERKALAKKLGGVSGAVGKLGECCSDRVTELEMLTEALGQLSSGLGRGGGGGGFGGLPRVNLNPYGTYYTPGAGVGGEAPDAGLAQFDKFLALMKQRLRSAEKELSGLKAAMKSSA